MPPRILLGVNCNFAKYVYGPRRAMEIARDEFGLRHVELVADNDFGPALFCSDLEAFRAHHRQVAADAADLGMNITCVFTVYRDCGAIGAANSAIRESAYVVGRSLIEQAACCGAPHVGASFFTLNAESAVNAHEFEAARKRALEVWKRWMVDAGRAGVKRLLVEMAATLREDCATIDQTQEVLRVLGEYHHDRSEETAEVGVCYDTGHGIGFDESADDRDRDYATWLTAFSASTYEIHLKDTDEGFLETWHFPRTGPRRGQVDLEAVFAKVRDTLTVPAVQLNLEVPGKRGRSLGEKDAIEAHKGSFDRIRSALTAVGYSQQEDGGWTC